VWARLADRAIRQYGAIEAASGIGFHAPCGGLYVAPDGTDDDYLATISAVGSALGVAHVQLDSAESITNNFPFFAFPDNCHAVYELPPAGVINPRRMVAAQLAVAQQDGATLIRDTAVSVQAQPDGVTVRTAAGASYRADRVLIAAGAFTNSYDLLQQKLALRVKSETIVLAEVPAGHAMLLQAMPTVIYEIVSPTLEGIYCTPPLRYPDGKLYLKIGCNTVADQTLPDLAAMRQWMMAGDSDVMAADIVAALRAMLPYVALQSWRSARCLVTYTPHGRPFVDQVGDRLYVATGGNGHSAKSADTMGYLAAQLMHGEAWEGFDSADFRAILA
jgi:sarcosine oxidase